MIKAIKFLTVALISLFTSAQAQFTSYATITFVGAVSGVTIDGEEHVQTLPTDMVQGDLVIYCQSVTATGLDLIAGEGFTGIQFNTDLADAYLSAAANDALAYCFAKFMGAVPDIDIAQNDEIGSADDGYTSVAFVFRGVDPGGEFGATAGQVTRASGSSTTPDSPSITTTTAGAVLVSIVNSDGSDFTVTGPTGWSDPTAIGFSETNDSNVIAMAWLRQPVAGTTDPPAWAGFANAAWNAATFALIPRPLGGPFVTAEVTDSPVSTAASDAAGAWTFSSAALGADTPNRATVVACGAQDSATNFTASSATLAGNAMTSVETTNESTASQDNASMWIINSAGMGATATIVVDHSEAVANAAGCIVFAVYGLRSLTATSSAGTCSADTSAGDDISATAGGVVLSYASARQNSGGASFRYYSDADRDGGLIVGVNETVETNVLYQTAGVLAPVPFSRGVNGGWIAEVTPAPDDFCHVTASFR